MRVRSRIVRVRFTGIKIGDNFNYSAADRPKIDRNAVLTFHTTCICAHHAVLIAVLSSLRADASAAHRQRLFERYQAPSTAWVHRTWSRRHTRTRHSFRLLDWAMNCRSYPPPPSHTHTHLHAAPPQRTPRPICGRYACPLSVLAQLLSF